MKKIPINILFLPLFFVVFGRLVFALVFFPNLYKTRPDILLATNVDHISFIGGVWGSFICFKYLFKNIKIKAITAELVLLILHVCYFVYLVMTDGFLGQKYLGYPAAFYVFGIGFLASTFLFLRNYKITD